MIIKDRLNDDFINEINDSFDKTLVNEILNEPIDDVLRHSEILRPGDSFTFYSLPLYVMVRLIKPDNVIETGTQNGGSAQCILYGLYKNNKGKLYSIDSGDMSTDGTHSMTNDKPGENITNYLKNRWELLLGFSYDVLPELINKLETVDLFFHDSDHSKKCVDFEFSEAIKKGKYVSLHDSYGQLDLQLLNDYTKIIGINRPDVHELNGQYHNVLRLWEKNI